MILKLEGAVHAVILAVFAAIQAVRNGKNRDRSMTTAFLLALATASMSFTLTETKLFKPFRSWINRHSAFAGTLFSCGYCLGFWISFVLVAIYQPRLFHKWLLMDLFLSANIIAWLGGIQWVIMCWLMQKAVK
jgi:hypothetical protein